MSAGSNKKRSKSSSSVTTPSPSLTVTNGLFECYYFLSYNEYSRATFGLLAFLVRNSVGDMNFSHICDEEEKQCLQGHTVNLVTLLEKERDSLVPNGPSIEKCLMLNRFILYIRENEAQFTRFISDIRLEMKLRMADESMNQTIVYPNDFRRREQDFNNRRHAQDMRRLFYLNHEELRKPPSLIHLQNRTTEHLSYIIDTKMRYDSKFRDEGLKELRRIFTNSFMITAQPHSGVNPITTYERKGPGEYTAKVSVTIVSLLHDFMVTHPNLIKLEDIEISLLPSSPLYKIDRPQTLSWETRELKISPNDKSQKIQYAELSFLIIKKTNKSDTGVNFTQKPHSLEFRIKLHVNLIEYKFSETYKISLESSPFIIGNRPDQIPRLLTHVILNDIEKHSKAQLPDVRTIITYLQRYFIHRTGVMPNEYLEVYLEEELNKAKNARVNFQTSEEIFTDFLTSYVHQVEFMAKHPVLAMLYADGFFLGTCNSERVEEIMMQPSDVNSPMFALRFNSIRIDYNTIATKSIVNRQIEPQPCAVRVIIYSHHTKKIANYTLESLKLSNDLCKLVFTGITEGAVRIRFLSNFHKTTNDAIYKYFNEFSKYYDIRLKEISATEDYKPLINLINDVKNEESNDGINQNNNPCSVISYLTDSISSATVNHEQSSGTDNVSIPSVSNNNNEASSQNVLLPTNQQENQILMQYVFSKPDLLAEFINRLQLTCPTVSVPQPQVLCENHYPQFPYGQQTEQSQMQVQQEEPLWDELFLQQPEVSSRINPCQSSKLYPTGDNNGTFQQIFQDDLDPTTTNQMMMVTNNQTFSSWFDELLR